MIVIDGFFAEDEFSWVCSNRDKLFEYTQKCFLWWDGWWKNPAGDNTIFQYLELIYRKKNPLGITGDYRHWTGMEYWTNLKAEPDWAPWVHLLGSGTFNPPSESGGWHVDDCTYSRRNLGEVMVAPWSLTFYLNDCEGGYLEIMDHGIDELEKPGGLPNDETETIEDFAMEHPERIQRIQARKNRLVVFNPSLWHRISPVTKGIRYSITTNLWDQKPWTAKHGVSPMATGQDDLFHPEELERHYPQAVFDFEPVDKGE